MRLMKKKIFEMIYNLPDKYKTVIILFYYENLDIKEISKVLHLSEAAVKKRLERARNILKEEESKMRLDEKIRNSKMQFQKWKMI